ncbi:MAG TPA: AbrB/MazE/SpoVT family DNA-binding domain-containing protein [Desulfobacteraceae bacterium]|nr:spoVT / AbrB like domain protein [bacterium BMS3Abin13]HDK43019.1 AbrB/MazE/SpoVT family DNA-binding domain-containing protein [Desulfobacteraceae bacterium]HDZ75783.1 AbrB/MazE/SpoVT family DNA-binding domain-containing protein [Desulfobacteraceae bacterium]
MPTIMKISPQGQIRIPNKIMNSLGIEKGDYVEVEVKDSDIILKPRKLIDPSQGWYWTKEWQEMEDGVDGEIEKGVISPTFKTAEEGLKWLKK